MTVNLKNMNTNSGSDTLPHPKYRRDIDGLRAVAIISVLLFHAFPNAIRGGFIGVDIFFVISGFLITSIIIGGLELNSFSFIDFYSKRIKRIFPSLILVLIACLLIGWFVLMPDAYKQLGKHILGGAGFFSNFILWNESGYFDNASVTKPLLHLWSLGVEEQFYIFWPILLFVVWKMRISFFKITICVLIFSFALNIYEVQRNATAAFYSPQTRIWELMAGAILAYMTLHKLRLIEIIGRRLNLSADGIAEKLEAEWFANVLSGLGVILILVGFFTISNDGNFPGWRAALPVVGASLMIAAGGQAWVNRKILSSSVLVWFGKISFPLYLWHWPLLAFAHMVESDSPSVEIRVGAILISILLAWLSFRFVEKPIRFGKNGKIKVKVLAALMIIIGSLGFYSYFQNGFDFRSKFNLQMSETKIEQERNNYWRNGQTNINFENHSPKVVIFGDSQAFDIFKAFKNDDKFGLKIYQIYYECSGFFSPSLGQENKKEDCLNLFNIFLNSRELAEADVLIYAHYWEKDRELTDNYRIGLQLIKKKNPRIRIYFFGPKPNLGNTYVSINEIIKGHGTTVGMNAFLNKVMVIRESDTQYAKKVAEDAGAIFVDVNEIYCQVNCTFYSENKFSYFDRNHWTEDGAKIFYQKFSRTDVYKNILSSGQ